MIMKMAYAYRVVIMLPLSALLVPLPAQEELSALKRTPVDKPGTVGTTIVSSPNRLYNEAEL